MFSSLVILLMPLSWILGDNGLSLNEAAEAKTSAALSMINTASHNYGVSLFCLKNPQYSTKFGFYTYMPAVSVPRNTNTLGWKLWTILLTIIGLFHLPISYASRT